MTDRLTAARRRERQERAAAELDADARAVPAGTVVVVCGACSTRIPVDRLSVPTVECPGCGAKLVTRPRSGPRHLTTRGA